MKKFVFLFLFLPLLLCGCNREKATILLSSRPIDAQNFEAFSMKSLFKPGEKIYYVLLNPEPFTSGKARLQILKLDIKAPYYGIDISQGRDIEIDTSKQYILGNFVLHRNGYYALRIFANEIYAYPLAETHFQVDDNDIFYN